MRYIFGFIAILCAFSLPTNTLSYPIETSHHFPSKESNGSLVVYNNKDRGFSFGGGFTLDFDWSVSNPFTISNYEFALTTPQIGFPYQNFTRVDVAWLSAALLGGAAGTQYAKITSTDKKRIAFLKEQRNSRLSKLNAIELKNRQETLKRDALLAQEKEKKAEIARLDRANKEKLQRKLWFEVD